MENTRRLRGGGTLQHQRVVRLWKHYVKRQSIFARSLADSQRNDEKAKSCRVNRRQCNTGDTVGADMRKHSGQLPDCKNKINIKKSTNSGISDIKLKRTDTTLDLSQKAVKRKKKAC
jgi:hypothetical protein